MYNGYIWRQKQQQNTLAQFVTLWIANTAGKSYKKELKLKDLFSDGRFDELIDENEIREIMEEMNTHNKG